MYGLSAGTTSYSDQPWLRPTNIGAFTPGCGTNIYTGAGASSSRTSSSGAGGKTYSTANETAEQREKRLANEKAKAAEQKAKARSARNQSTIFAGLTKAEERILTEYHTEKQEYVENLGTSLIMGTGMGIFLPNASKLTQTFSAGKAAFSKNSTTNQLFKDVVKSDIWKNEANLLQDAYAQMYKAEVRSNSWKAQGIFKRGYSATEFEFLKDEMQAALQSGNKDRILEATARLKNADTIGEGWMSNAFNWVKGKLGMKTKAPVDVVDKMTQTNEVQKQMAGLAMSSANSTFKGALKNSVGGKIGILFALTGLISEFKYIKAAFKEDTSTGFKQLGQSIAKAGSSWGGYVLGDALGKWGGAKLGSMIGTAVCPGLGTAVGAVAGVLCGTVLSWGLRKVTNLVVGDNVANELIAKNDLENASKSPEQQMQLLQTIVANAEADKNLDADTKRVVEKVKQMYA